jgi:cytochrome c2
MLSSLQPVGNGFIASRPTAETDVPMVARSTDERGACGLVRPRRVRIETWLSSLAALRLLPGLVVVLGLSLVTSAAMAEGDPLAGKRVFAKCAICHTAEPGKNKIGPSLFNLIGRPAGSASGYTYSQAMHDLNKIWDTAVLDEYLAAPKAMVPGTKMTFPGIANKQERDDIIAFLGTLR